MYIVLNSTSLVKDLSNGDWWLFVGKTVLGYWPEELLHNLNKYAITVDWGGSAMVPPDATYSPPMGSGEPAL